MKVCSACQKNKRAKEFYSHKGKLSSKCKDCSRRYQLAYVGRSKELAVIPKTPAPVVTTIRDPTNPRDAKEISMKRMLSGAKTRAREKGLMFNLHYDDIQIPNLCPVLKIPLIPSEGMSDGSPSLDRMIPYLGYTKGNVKVISMKANRIKTDATSNEIKAVLQYVIDIEEMNT